MPDLFSMTAPLSIRLPDGEMRVVAELFPCVGGLVWFDLYWHLAEPGKLMHRLEGEVTGEGPWKIDGHVFNVLGCHGTDPELAGRHAAWSEFLSRADSDYPPPGLVAAIARRFAAECG